ncbi:MAG: hypothetical protein OXC97_00815 [Candidatus Dadabacteria bacterium]|nr:hypothetical protein [Candidatus Dadabacteria bacterium]
MKNEKTAKSHIDGDSYLKLTGDTEAFLQAAELLEERICNMKIEPSNMNRIGGSTGWIIHDIWESLKTASHFNFGIAFELRMKSILKLNVNQEQNLKIGHNLEKIYSLISSEIWQELEDIFTREVRRNSLHLSAFVRSKYEYADPPPNRNLNDLKDFCIYFDKDMKLWLKRYSWEDLSEKTHVHYFEDLSPLINFVRKAEKTGNCLARELGIIK